MRIFFIFTLIFAATKTHASLDDIVSNLEKLNTSLNSKEKRSCDINPTISPLFVRAQEEHQILFNCSDAENFQKMRAFSAWRYCKPRFGDSAQTCTERDPAILEQRMKTSELMNEILTFTKNTFETYKLKLANRCCLPDQKNCLNRFEKLKLIIEENHSPRAQYVSDSAPINFYWNQIEVTTAKLASEYTKEGIERMLLHEFGHVCQFALISEDKEHYQQFTSPQTRCLFETGQKSFDVSKLKTLACVNTKLTALKNRIGNSSYCYGKWYREAFADMIFRDEMNTVYHWIYDMHRTKASKNYGEVFDYIQCDLENFPKEKTCH